MMPPGKNMIFFHKNFETASKKTVSSSRAEEKLPALRGVCGIFAFSAGAG